MKYWLMGHWAAACSSWWYKTHSFSKIHFSHKPFPSGSRVYDLSPSCAYNTNYCSCLDCTSDKKTKHWIIIFWTLKWVFFGLLYVSVYYMEELSWVDFYYFIQVVITLIQWHTSARNVRDAQTELSSIKTNHQEQKRQNVNLAHQVSLCWTHERSRNVQQKRVLYMYLFL